MKPALPVWLASLAAALVAAVPALAQDTTAVELVDRGTFKIYLKERALGTEDFSLATRGDSLLVFSHTRVVLEDASAPDTIEKSMTLIASLLDFDLLNYESSQRYRGQKLKRGLVLDDTLYTAYREIDERGEGVRLVRPPGKIFIEDPQLYVLYDLICRNLNGKVFDSRPIQMLVLGHPDTILEATVTDLGVEPVSWGGKTVKARKLGVSRADAEFAMWVSSRGQMLRLEQPEYALRIEREPPPAKRAKRPGRRGG